MKKIFLLFLISCSSKHSLQKSEATQLCKPQCNNNCNVYDGCGGICTCSHQQVCNEINQCVTPQNCSAQCSDFDFQCMSLCGASCGSCREQSLCMYHTCYPATSMSCESCVLKIIVDTPKESNQNTYTAQVHIFYHAPEAEALSNFDLQLSTNILTYLHDIRISSQQPTDAFSLELQYKASDIVILHGKINHPKYAIQQGELITFEYTIPKNQYASFTILPQENTLRPLSADLLLHQKSYSGTVVIPPLTQRSFQ